MQHAFLEAMFVVLFCFVLLHLVFLGSHDTRFIWFSSYPNNHFSVTVGLFLCPTSKQCSSPKPWYQTLYSSPSKQSHWVISLVIWLLNIIHKIIQLRFIFQDLTSLITIYLYNFSTSVSTRRFKLHQDLSSLLDFILRSPTFLAKPSLFSPVWQQKALNSLSASAISHYRPFPSTETSDF